MGGHYAAPLSSPTSPRAQMPFVDAETNGVWASPKPITGNLHALSGRVTAISCTSSGYCGIAGYAKVSNGKTKQAFVSTWYRGILSPARVVAGNLNVVGNASATDISCVGVGTCVVGGTFEHLINHPRAFVADEVGGVWQLAQEVAGALNLGTASDRGAQITSVSCASTTSCSAGGSYLDARQRAQAFVIDEVNGKWLAAQQVAGSLNVFGEAAVTSISCVVGGFCGAGGYYSNGSRKALVLNKVDGIWAATP